MAALSFAFTFIHEYLLYLVPALFILYLLSNRYQKGLHRIPGPWINSITTLPRMWSIYKGQHQMEDLRLHARYGKMVRIAPNLISISDPNEISHVYGISTKFTKSGFYDLASVYDDEGMLPDPFVIRDDKALHTRMKRNAANAYSMNGLVQFEPWLDPVISRLLCILDSYADKDEVFNMGKLIKHFAMDAVCSLTFGRDMSYLENGDRLNFFKTLDLFTAYMSIFGHVSWLHPFILGNRAMANFATRNSTSSQAMMDISTQELQKYRSAPPREGEPMNFLGRLALNQKEHEKTINDREIITHALGNISAGSDTTAIAMTSVLYHLMTHKFAYDRLCEEIRGQLSFPVRFQDANRLPYLKAVIQEAMRLHPSVGQLLGRIVPSGGSTIGGYFIGAGAEVGMSPWVLHRDQDVFPEPDAFRPERWILGEGTLDEHHLRQMNRSFFAFGHGAHTCSGKHISIMEMTKLIPTLLLKYDLKLEDSRDGYTFKNWWFTPQGDLQVRLAHRQALG